MESIFSNRNSKLLLLNHLADSLGHALRENVSIFSIDDLKGEITFITEQNKVIRGRYYLNGPTILDNIVVESTENFTNDEKFDSVIKDQISSFVNSIHANSLAEADTKFNDIVDSWVTRTFFNKTIEKLEEKVNYFNNTYKIMSSPEINKLSEIQESLVTFLKENKDSLLKIPEVVNSVRLSDTVSKAFDISKLTLEELGDLEQFEVPQGENFNIYEMVCKQELVKKELLESKQNFDLVWVTEDVIADLAICLFEEDDTVIANKLVEAIVNVPYLALISKKQISSTIQKVLDTLHEEVSYNKNDLKEFTSKVFEMKKPLKEIIVNLLQEKYGVNINNSLKDIPTFKSLLNTQVVIFESLNRVAPKGSVLKTVLSEVSEMLKSKNGVEALDVNTKLQEIFGLAGFNEILSKPISISFNLSESKNSELSDIDSLVKLVIEAKTSEEEPPLPHDDEPPAKESKKKKSKKDDDEDEDKEVEQGKAEKDKEIDEEESSEEGDSLEEEEELEEVELSTKDLLQKVQELEALLGRQASLEDK